MSIDKRKKFGFLIFAIFLFCFFFYLLDKNEILEIKSQNFKSFVYLGLIPLSFFSILFSFFSFNKIKTKFILSFLPTIAIIQILSFGIIKTIYCSSTWKTQTIIYQNKLDKSKKVEFQMMDKGALGYQRRTIEINYFTNWFFISKEFGNYNSDWEKVTIEINELGMK
jgi:4-amino-4-deoxy-L-arabinose transferase-like glycosyltransferase